MSSSCPEGAELLCKKIPNKNNPVENIVEIMASISEAPFILGMMIITVLVGTGYLIFFFLTLFYFSPTHRCVSDILNSFIFWIYTNIQDQLFGATLTGYLLILFGSLVYNEIIILNFWGFDFNTKGDISRRSVFEAQILIQARDHDIINEFDDQVNISLEELTNEY